MGNLEAATGNPGWGARKKLLSAQKLAGLKEEIKQGLLKNDSDCMGGL